MNNSDGTHRNTSGPTSVPNAAGTPTATAEPTNLSARVAARENNRASHAPENADTPEAFTTAVESMHAAQLRPEVSLGTIRPPQRLAPYSHAVGLEISSISEDADIIPTDTEGDAFGRLILLHDPGAEEAWDGAMRLVAYIQADMDSDVAGDPLLPDVAWQWLTEGLADHDAHHTNLGGTVTSTASVRFGEIGGPPRAHQMEMRASWTAESEDLRPHVEAFANVLANVAGLPPEGVTELGR
ncbi:DUF3000 domain-containing protein [Corynebacterium incognita]|uniref:DUF3000 domain-containing protein n=1 Tax=Corynebacterium incognita TaxID=2754725 RepID=A0A7G7CQ13_9CORY|nr:DUF3000 domain-containing protein [Corynebacterium incognita]QNE89679.1 DUF3000 domain-containing protein [Corynebacterium incognita]